MVVVVVGGGGGGGGGGDGGGAEACGARAGQVVQALAHLHSGGLVHCDVQPDNIMARPPHVPAPRHTERERE